MAPSIWQTTSWNQVRYWGISPSFAVVSEPEPNGVAETFNRTIKEQVIYGGVFRNIEDLRTAIADFINKYNQQWLIESWAIARPHRPDGNTVKRSQMNNVVSKEPGALLTNELDSTLSVRSKAMCQADVVECV